MLSISILSAGKVKVSNLWDDIPAGTTRKIDSTKKNLTQTSQKKNQLNRQLSQIAKSIRKIEKENKSLSRSLVKLKKAKDLNENRFKKAKKKIDNYKGTIKTLDRDMSKQNEHFKELMANQFSFMLAMEKIDKRSVDSVIMEEIYKSYKSKNAKELSSLKMKINRAKKEKSKTLKYQKSIEKSISKISKQREAYLKKKKEKDMLLKKLLSQESLYRKNIKTIMKKQSMIRSTLAKLKIIRQEEITKEKELEKARQAEIKRRAQARRKSREKEATNTNTEHETAKHFTNNENVRQMGSSYHKDKIYRYRGAKTISPLKGAKLVKSFGTYIDPLYKMKIFNESITLKAPQQDAKVRNVLNGKVVFAGENSMLGKVIIIAHGGKLHTIYAGLSKIPKDIRVGRRVIKGKVIGKVKRKLIFEATKNSKYINPIRLIRL